MTLHSCSLGEREEQNCPDSEGPDRGLRENTEVGEDKMQPGFCVSVFSILMVSKEAVQSCQEHVSNF